MRSCREQPWTADVRIVTSSDALEEETPPFETQMPPPNPACHAANLLGHFGSVARVPTSPSSSCLLTCRALQFSLQLYNILFLFHCISYNVYLPKPILSDPLLRRPGSPRTDPSCLIAYRGLSLRPVNPSVQLPSPVRRADTLRDATRPLLSLVLSHCCETVERLGRTRL
jgi:hypothetical protein